MSCCSRTTPSTPTWLDWPRNSLPPCAVDIYSIQQFYVAMSIFKAHGLNPRIGTFSPAPASRAALERSWRGAPINGAGTVPMPR